MKKMPWYVESLSKNGARRFKPEFIATLLGDITSGRTTIAKARKDFDLSEAVVYQWLKKANGGKRANFAHRAIPAVPAGNSLLSQAIALGEAPTKAVVEDKIDQHIELCMAFLEGKVKEDQVKKVLQREGKSKFMITTWIGRVLGYAVKNHKLVLR